MRITKEGLSKENSKLAHQNNELQQRLDYLRKELSRVFGYYPQHSLYSISDTKSVSWEEIFFRIGELNSDANYTILLEQKHMIENELRQIKDGKPTA